MLTSAEIRQKFLDFFASKEHVIVPSAPIVVKNDPTLLFTNAGMNQFKDIFLGNQPVSHPRVADTQKCLRVSGKHNDLEEVGVDTYHHTMFEMLGNWSFGDYFKKEAIAWSWELLTNVLGLDKDRLYVTIFEGDASENLPKDEEAENEWKKWLPEERILKGNKKDNFWEMGDTGPCGPCTEIHVDCRTDDERTSIDGSTLVNNDHPQVIEIWNNVFIQFNRSKDGKLEPLPARHVDTGMGFERLVRVIQQKSSNYDTDIFAGTLKVTGEITGKVYGGTDSRADIAFRVIADHIRAISFTIADGQLPSNTGAGYVIRRILRRAVRYAYSYLDFRKPLLNQLVTRVALQFKYVFPELYNQAEFVSRVIREEEESFLKTLDKGINRFNIYTTPGKTLDGEALVPVHPENEDDIRKLTDQQKFLKERHSKVVAGEFAFELNDTYGFPIDLTTLMAKEIGWTVDQAGFQQALQVQKDRSRAATALDTGDWVQLEENNQSAFVGYDEMESDTRLVKYRKVKAKGKESYQLVLQETPFYAESGGQVGDTGIMEIGGETIDIIDTRKENDLFIQFSNALPSNLTARVTARVNARRRQQISVHHTATHLLHAALRSVLGNHVAQKGSMVNDEQLRFDFSHFAKMTEEEIRRTEHLVNEKIRANIPVVIKWMKKDEALAMGAMALFGEKYGDLVRVVVIDPGFSVELCGGTHVGATGELGLLKIRHESAVAAGVRRIEAVSGKNAIEFIDEQLAELQTIRAQFKNPRDLTRSIETILAENADLKKKLEHQENRLLVGIRNELMQKDQIINGVTFVGEIITVTNAEALRKLCTDLKNNLHDHLVVLCANIGGKPAVAIGISDTVVAARNLDAAKIIKEQVAPLIKGGGGGQKNLATAGGQDASALDQVIERVKSLLF
ncbi:alanine--tRNA ligase [Flavitalea antarctica]